MNATSNPSTAPRVGAGPGYSRETAEALTLLVTRHGFYGSLLYDLLTLEESTAVPVAATDGRRVYLHPVGFGGRPIQHRAYILAHEALHAGLDHHGRGENYRARGFGPDGFPFDAAEYNRAADMVINAALNASGLDCPPDALLAPPGMVTPKTGVDALYCQLMAGKRARQQAQADQAARQRQQQPQQPAQDDAQDGPQGASGDDGEADDQQAGPSDDGDQSAPETASGDGEASDDGDTDGEPTSGDGEADDAQDGDGDGADGEPSTGASTSSAGEPTDGASDGEPTDGASGDDEGPLTSPSRHGGFDDHLPPPPPGSDEHDTRPTQAERTRALQAAVDVARTMGQAPAGIVRHLLDEVLDAGAAQDWRDILREHVARAIRPDSTSWRRLNRRRLVLTPSTCYPGRIGGAGFVVIQIDTSGSVQPAELDLFMREVAVILDEVRPERTLLLWTDSRVAGTDEIEDPYDLETVTPKGGGGTDMVAGLRWLDQHGERPDVLITFTDGWTPYPEADDVPDYPLIWALTPGASISERRREQAEKTGDVIQLTF